MGTSSWLKVRLEEVAQATLGKMLDAKRVNGLSLPYLRNQNVRWDAFDLSDLYEMPFEEHELVRYGVLPGDLLICEGGEPGRCAVWTTAGSDVKFQKAIHRVRPSECLDARFALHHIRWSAQTQQLAQYFTGTTIKHFTGRALDRYEFLLPPLNEQRRIVDKIDALFAHSKKAKESLDRIPALLEKLKRSILAAAFRGDLTKDWREAHPDVEPADVLLARIRAERRRRWEEAELARLTARGKVPGDNRWKQRYDEHAGHLLDESADLPWSAPPSPWRSAPLNELCDATRGITYGIVQTGDDVPGGVPTVRCGDIKDFAIRANALKRVEPALAAEYGRTTLGGGEVLIAIRGTVGAPAVATEALRGCNISREVAAIPVLPGLDAEFLALFLASPGAQQQIAGHVKGVAQQGINLADLRTLRVPVPALSEQHALVRAVQMALSFARTSAEIAGRASLKNTTLDAAILAKAFGGELVRQDPADEPASALLERIRAAREASSASSDTPQKRPRTRRTAAPAPTPLATASDDPGVAPTNPTSFIDLLRADQLPLLHAALRGVGPVPADAAIRLVADHLRERHLADFSRLRSDGPLYAAIEKALDAAVRAELLDRPQRGHVRAIVSDPKDYTGADWRRCLEGALADRAESDPEPDEDDLIRAAAEWAVVNMGLVHQRLRSGGLVHQRLSRALRVGVPAAAHDARPT